MRQSHVRVGLILCVVIGVIACVPGSWGWKKATDPDDVMKFMNGQAPYTAPVKDARITLVWKETYPEYHVFYQAGTAGQSAGNWGWKLATDVDDVHNFINGKGAYQHPVKDARISLMWKGNHPEFYVFYQAGTAPHDSGLWGWKLATDPDDVMNFLNGTGAYQRPVTAARIAAMEKEGHTEYYVFYQRVPGSPPITGWGWKKATDADDVMNFLNGTGAYQQPVKNCEICAVRKAAHVEFYVFYTR